MHPGTLAPLFFVWVLFCSVFFFFFFKFFFVCFLVLFWFGLPVFIVFLTGSEGGPLKGHSTQACCSVFRKKSTNYLEILNLTLTV